MIYLDNNVPGANAYSLNKLLMGKNYNSKFRSGPYIEMHRKLENELKIRNDTPGPGSYLSFSEFGVWVPKSMSRTKHLKKSMNTLENDFDNKLKNYFRKLMDRARNLFITSIKIFW